MISWNDAADSQESVASDALVMPISSGRPSRGALSGLDQLAVDRGVALVVDALAWQERRVAGLGDQHPAVASSAL